MNHLTLIALVVMAAVAAHSAPAATFGPYFSGTQQAHKGTWARPLAGQLTPVRRPKSFMGFSPPLLNNRKFESRIFGTRPRFGRGFLHRRRSSKHHRPRFRSFGHARG